MKSRLLIIFEIGLYLAIVYIATKALKQAYNEYKMQRRAVPTSFTSTKVYEFGHYYIITESKNGICRTHDESCAERDYKRIQKEMDAMYE